MNYLDCFCGEAAKRSFTGDKGARFLQHVQGSDQEFGVDLMLHNRTGSSQLGTTHSPVGFQTSHHSCARATKNRWREGGGHQLLKTDVAEPSIFKAEAPTLRDPGGCREQWNMVRGSTGERGKGSVGKSRVPINVNEASVKTNKSGVRPLVTPCVGSVKERDFNQPDTINNIVEHMRFTSVKSPRVFVDGGPHKIKVPDDHLGAGH